MNKDIHWKNIIILAVLVVIIVTLVSLYFVRKNQTQKTDMEKQLEFMESLEKGNLTNEEVTDLVASLETVETDEEKTLELLNSLE